MLTIRAVHARQIVDSRGSPTVEAEVALSDGAWGRAAAPSGASTGSREAVEKRDGGTRWCGKGVGKAVTAIKQEIGPALLGCKADLATVDAAMCALDASENKENLGANAILAVSMACSHALADSCDVPLYRWVASHLGNRDLRLPVPMMNIINGGAHAANNVDFQEVMIVPAGFGRFESALRCGGEIFHALKKVLQSRKLNTAVGDEGGFAPDLACNEEALRVIMQAVEQAGYKAGEEVFLALDVAASELYVDGRYILAGEGRRFRSSEFSDYLIQLCDRYPIVSIEDGLDEDDWQGWKALTIACGDRNIQLVGDDLFVTNPSILRRGIEEQVANAILVKANQIGTLSETFEALQTAAESGYRVIMSHRSGETEDVTIADLAVGSSCGQIKAGSVSRTDRVAKYNQLLRIEEQLGDDAAYAGKKVFAA